jgi:ABC-2 type transport system permease protein
MIRDIFTVAWKEWQEYVQQERTRRAGPLRGLAFVAAGGVFLGWQLDPDFGRSWLTVMLTTFLSIMFVTTVVPDSFAGERERHTLETLLASRLSDRAILLGKVAAAVSYGWAISLAVLPVGVAAANLIHDADGLPWAYPGVVGAAVLLSLLCGLLIAGVGVQLSMYSPTARQAHQRLGFVILGIFMTPAVAVPALPWAWRERMVGWFDEVGAMWLAGLGLSLLLLACVLLLLVAMLRFHRARLIL